MALGDESILLGIELTFDSQGMISGARVADQAFDRMRGAASETANAVTSEMDRMQQLTKKSLVLIGAGITTAFVGRKITGFLEQGTDQARAFGEGMFNVARVAELLGDDGTAQLAKFRDELLDIGIRTPFSPVEATEGLEALISVGLESNDAMATLDSTLQLVQASGERIGIGKAALATGSLLAKFKLDVNQATEALDQFVRAGNATALAPEEINTFLRSMGSAPADLNLATQEVFALGGALRNFGQTPAQAGQSIQGMTRRLVMLQQQIDEGRKGKKLELFKSLGVDIFDANKEFRGLGALMPDILDAFGRMGSEQERATAAQAIFGQQAKNVLGAVGALSIKTADGIIKGGEAFQFLIADIEKNSSGTLRKTAEAFAKTSAGIEKLWEGTKDTILLVLGESLLPIFDVLIEKATSIGNAFLEFSKANPVVVRTLTQVAFAIGTVLTAVGSLLVVVGSLGLLIAGFKVGLIIIGVSLTTLVTGIGVAIAAIVGIGAAIAGLVAFVQAGIFDPILNPIQELTTAFGVMWTVITGEGITTSEKELLERLGLLGITEWLASTGDLISSFFEGFGAGIDTSQIGSFVEILTFMVDQVVLGLKPAWDELTKAIGLTGFATGDTRDTFRDIGAFIGTMAVSIGTIAKFLLLTVVPVIRFAGIVIGSVIGTAIGLLDSFVGVVSGMANVVGGLIFAFIGIFQGLLSGSFENMRAGLNQAFGGLIDIVTNLASGLFNLTVGLFVRIGEGIVGAISSGILAKWEGFKNFFSDKWQEVRDFLPFSDAKVGPLSDLTMSGERLVQTIQVGTESQFPMLEQSVMAGLEAVRRLFGDDVAGSPLPPPVDGDSPEAPAEVPVGEGGVGITQINKTVTVTFGDIMIQTPETGETGVKDLADSLLDRIKKALEEDREDQFFG